MKEHKPCLGQRLSDYEAGNITMEAGFECLSDCKSLKALLDSLTEVFVSIPAEFRDGASLDWDASDYSACVRILYTRPKTAEDVAKEAEEIEEYRKDEELEEKQEFARLQAKYGGKI